MKVYEQIIIYIKDQIATGALRHGDRAPSVRQLCDTLGTSKNSVIRAYQALESEGLINAYPRKGFIVSSTPHVDKPPSPRRVVLGATALDIIGPAQKAANVAFGSANPETAFKGRTAFYKQLSRLTRKELTSPATYTHYQSPPGNQLLRQQIARKTHSGFAELDPEEIIITNGAQEAISLALRSLTSTGDIVLVESPCFYGILQCIEALGLRVIELPSSANIGIQVEQLEQILQQWSVKVVLLNPQANNPLGFIMPEENQRKLLQLSYLHQFHIIEDDVFGSLIPTSQRKQTLKAMDTQGRVLLCSGLSKILDPDIRIGWIAAGVQFDQINYLKYVTTLATSGLLQQAAALWMASPDYERHIRQIQNRYRQRKVVFVEVLRRVFPPEAEIIAPDAGFLCWISLPSGCSGDRIFDQAKYSQISITPGSLFGTEGQFRHCIRLNFSSFTQTDLQMNALLHLSKLLREEILRAQKNPD